jgi:hypothetical protein
MNINSIRQSKTIRINDNFTDGRMLLTRLYHVHHSDKPENYICQQKDSQYTVYTIINVGESVMCVNQQSMYEDYLYSINLVKSSEILMNAFLLD